MSQIIQRAPIINVASSAYFENTEKREYFDGIGTSPTPDAYGRVVSADSMPQIAIDFSNNLRVLDSHKHDTNGVGQTVRGEVIKEIVESVEIPKVHFTAYILKGLKLDGQTYQSTDDWAEVIRDGMANSFSIGFFSERDICNICQLPIFSYKCRHYPLEWAEVTDPETGEEKRVQCTYTCFECQAVEVSFVYSPANPDARLIQKAKALAENNLFLPEQIQRIENRLNTAILEPTRSYFDMPFSPEDKQEITAIVKTAMTEAQTAAPPAPAGQRTLNITDANGTVIRQIHESEIPQPKAPLTETEITTAVQTAMAPFGERLTQIETAMKSGDGIDAREKASAEWKKQFKRVYGKDPDETQVAALEVYPDVASIEIVTQGLKQTADTLFKAGRQSAGLGDELEGEDPNGDDGKPSLAEVRAQT